MEGNQVGEAYLNGSSFIILNTARRVVCELVAQPEDMPYLVAEKGLEANVLIGSVDCSSEDVDVTQVIAIWEKGLRPDIAGVSGVVAHGETTFAEIGLKLERDSDQVAVPFLSRLVEGASNQVYCLISAYLLELRRPRNSTRQTYLATLGSNNTT